MPAQKPCRVLLWRLVAQRGMRSSFVVVSTPRLYDGLGLAKTHKPMSIQTLVPKTTVETFDKGVLDGTTRFDEVEDDAASKRPGVEVMRSELGSVVDGDGLRLSSTSNHRIERLCDPL